MTNYFNFEQGDDGDCDYPDFYGDWLDTDAEKTTLRHLHQNLFLAYLLVALYNLVAASLFISSIVVIFSILNLLYISMFKSELVK